MINETREDRGSDLICDRDGTVQRVGTASVRGSAGESSTGLGLIIVRRIVEGHGGSIRVERAVGEGSTFYFLLPAGGDHHRRSEFS